MDELKFTGNTLKGSRPILSFDKSFDEEPHLRLMKDIFSQVFATPNMHPKSKPFIDHVLSFCYVDGRIWFRNYQIADEYVLFLSLKIYLWFRWKRKKERTRKNWS